ncbi:MAG: haloalkane dehalogenase [Chitinophagales bacterium]
MEIKYTPDHCFDNLPDYPFAPNYLEVAAGLRMHYLDEGDKNAVETVFLLHGEPSWSFLYRFMIPVFVEQGYRVIVPDLIGFGKSGKPTQTNDYTYAKHIMWTKSLVDQLNLQNVTLFCQDWGGLVGLRLLTAMPERFNRLVVANTGLPTGDHEMPKAFKQWQQFSQTVEHFPVGMILQNSTVRKLTDAEINAYKAPFPDDSYMAGARIFPALVPTTPDNAESANNRAAWQVLMQWQKPCLTLFSDKDPVTKGGQRPFEKLVPGTKEQPHQIITNAGHFLQEDKGKEIAEIMVEWMKVNE